MQNIFAKTKLTTDALYILTLRVLQIFLQFSATYFIVRAISQEDYGRYQFLLGVFATLAIFSFPGINNAIMQSVARGFQGTYIKSVPLCFLFSLVGAVILLGFSVFYYAQNNTTLFYGFAIAGVLFPFYHGLRQWRNLLTGNQSFRQHFLFSGIEAFLTYICIIISVWLFQESLLAPLLPFLFIPAVQNLFLTLKNFKSIAKDADVEDGVIPYGMKTSAFMAITIVANHIEKLLLFWFLTPISLAIFVVSSRFADLFQNLNQDLAVVLAPRFAKLGGYTAKINKYIRIYSLIYSIGILIFALAFVPFLITFIFGEQYNESIFYAQLLLFSVCIGNGATIKFRYIRSVLDAKSHRDVVMWASLLKIFSACVLVPFLAVYGAIASVFIYKIAMVIVVNVSIKKHYLAEKVLENQENE